MNLDHAQTLLESKLRSPLGDRGFFRASPLVFSRDVNDAKCSLALPCRIDFSGVAWFACNVALRFRALDSLLSDSSPEQTPPHIMVPIHLLGERNNFREWSFTGQQEAEIAVAGFLVDVEEFAIPFLSKNSRLATLRVQLDSPQPKDWFALSPEDRIALHAAIRFISGESDSALREVQEALAARASALPKKRRVLEELQNRMRRQSL